MWQRQEYDRPEDVMFARPTNRAIKSGMVYEEEKPLHSKETKQKKERKRFSVIKLQSIIACVVLLMVVLTKLIAPNYFVRIQEQYAALMSLTLSEQEKQTALELTEDALAILGEEQESLIEPQVSEDPDVQEQVGETSSTEEEGVTSSESEVPQGAPQEQPGYPVAQDSTYTLSVEPKSPIENGVLTSGFGTRVSPITGEEEFHSGIDITAADGSVVLSVSECIITRSVYDNISGNYIKIEHSGGFESGYYHLEERLVEVGETVTAGEEIGIIGNTGLSTGTHLHMTFIVDGEKVDPIYAYSEGTFE